MVLLVLVVEQKIIMIAVGVFFEKAVAAMEPFPTPFRWGLPWSVSREFHWP